MYDTRLKEAISAILKEIDRCPGDSLRDIANDMFEEWQVPLEVDADLGVNETYNVHVNMNKP